MFPARAEQYLLVTWISPRCHGHCLGRSAQCHPLWLNFSILWTFDPCPSFGYFFPQLLILVSLHFCWNISSLRCAKPLITCLYGQALAETPSKGEEQQRLFVYLLGLGLFFLNLFFPPLLLPPHNKISSYAQKANLATLTTLRTLFSSLSFYMSFKSLNVLNKFFRSLQVGASCNMHWFSDCSTFALVWQVIQRRQLHNILICHRSALPLIGKLLLSTINVLSSMQ